MGAGRIGEIAERLIDGGLAPPTRRSPRCATAPAPTSARCGPRSRRSATPACSAPCAIVVGDVAALDLAWFEARPLFGRSVVVTRAREQASELRARLEALGAEVRRAPGDRDRAASTFAVPDLARVRLAGVHVGQRRATRSSTAASRPPGSTPARSPACGSRPSARAPRTRSPRAASRADLVPERVRRRVAARRVPRPRGAGRARAARPRRAGARRAARRARRARLRGRRARPCTARVPATPDPAMRRRACATATVDAITFTSSSTVDNFCDAGRRASPTRSPLVVSIGPVTSETARDRGLRVDAEADRAHHRRPRRRPLTLLASLTGHRHVERRQNGGAAVPGA